jgi:hypothetical protein
VSITEQPKHPGGRPTLYSPELAAAICERMSEGKSLRAVCRSDDMPAASTVHRWLTERPEFQEQYGSACEARTEALFEECLEIADDSEKDVRVEEGEDGPRMVVDWEVINRAKLRVDTRKWMVGKLAPKKYGERLQVEDTRPPSSLLPDLASLDAEKLMLLAKIVAEAKEQRAPVLIGSSSTNGSGAKALNGSGAKRKGRKK